MQSNVLVVCTNKDSTHLDTTHLNAGQRSTLPACQTRIAMWATDELVSKALFRMQLLGLSQANTAVA